MCVCVPDRRQHFQLDSVRCCRFTQLRRVSISMSSILSLREPISSHPSSHSSIERVIIFVVIIPFSSSLLHFHFGKSEISKTYSSASTTFPNNSFHFFIALVRVTRSVFFFCSLWRILKTVKCLHVWSARRWPRHFDEFHQAVYFYLRRPWHCHSTRFAFSAFLAIKIDVRW